MIIFFIIKTLIVVQRRFVVCGDVRLLCVTMCEELNTKELDGRSRLYVTNQIIMIIVSKSVVTDCHPLRFAVTWTVKILLPHQKMCGVDVQFSRTKEDKFLIIINWFHLKSKVYWISLIRVVAARVICAVNSKVHQFFRRLVIEFIVAKATTIISIN